eukprot:6516439-Ditylum_brightwellii.AAC.1
MASPTFIYNDNNACVCWAHNLTTKGLRHIQIRENAVRESAKNNTIEIQHIAGDINLSDLFAKEDKNTSHFLQLHDILLTIPPTISNPTLLQPSGQHAVHHGQDEGMLVCPYVLRNIQPSRH